MSKVFIFHQNSKNFDVFLSRRMANQQSKILRNDPLTQKLSFYLFKKQPPLHLQILRYYIEIIKIESSI